MTIKPDYLTLNNLLQYRLFRIPNYQRAYSWRTKQRQELFNDIKKLVVSTDGERHHFMSTIVCLKQNTVEEVGSEEFEIFEVVDGQQRLTTLIILLKAIAKNLEDQKEAEKLNELLVKDDRRLILLQTNHDNSHIFYKYLQEGIVPQQSSLKFVADRNMAMAFSECEDFVQKWENGASNLLKVIKNRLDFIFYVLEEEAAVYTIFEVLNSRGLEVDWLDKCKSILMGTAFEKFKPDARTEHIEELHKIWTQIYATIGLDIVPGNEILNFAATLSIHEPQSRIMSSEKSLEFFRNFCQENPKSIFKISQRFLDVAIQLKELYQNPRLKAVSDIIQGRLLALAIRMKNSLTESEKKEVLECWEKVTFRIYGLFRKDARTKGGEYIRLAREIYFYDSDLNDPDPEWGYFRSDLKKDAIIEKIRSLGSDLPIEKAIEELKGSDCYNVWSSEEIRYFFYRYEEYLAQTQGISLGVEIWEQIWNCSPNETIEHIHPQNPDSNWTGKIRAKNPEELNKQIHRLGNLMLLPPKINLQASNKAFVDKKKIYSNNNHLRLMSEILQLNDWNMKMIANREEKLLEWAKVTWG